MTSPAGRVRIHYHRLPDRHEVFEQALVDRSGDGIVTFMERTPLAAPLRVDGRVVLEPGSPVVWFTFPGQWHDVGLFHDAAGRRTGVYANVLTPVEFHDERTWATTDLFLDVWLDRHGARLLDEAELEAAVVEGWIDEPLAERARAEARTLIDRHRSGSWPPPILRAWPLDRVMKAVHPSS